MPTETKITVDHIYDRTPSLGHRAGDIWSGLPFHGMLGLELATGIVITPDCDLTNHKVETITYLPVLPLKHYFSTPAIMPIVLRALRGQLEAAKLNANVDQSAPFHCPTPGVLNSLASIVGDRLRGTTSGKERITLERADAGLRILMQMSHGADARETSHKDCAKLLGAKEWRHTLQSLVRNSFSADLHFLPPDQSHASWSAVYEPALVLFRYPLSTPIQILDSADDISSTDWPDCLRQLNVPGHGPFETARPLKRAQLRPRFFADLLTRYIGMHVRLGSPDFTPETIGHYVELLIGNEP